MYRGPQGPSPGCGLGREGSSNGAFSIRSEGGNETNSRVDQKEVHSLSAILSTDHWARWEGVGCSGCLLTDLLIKHQETELLCPMMAMPTLSAAN